ncbi:MAG: hypothetical protein IKF53_06050 [Clostridia bacterium]|nr:hypothetical protein [Clostridia bacterium]
MNIEPSVLIWTVICFCAFALVINNLLFRPILKVMDERQKKIDKWNKKANLMETEAAERKAKKAEEAAISRENAKYEAAKKKQELKAAAEQKLAEMRKENEDKLNSKINELKSHSLENAEIINGKMDDFVAAFTEKLVTYR